MYTLKAVLYTFLVMALVLTVTANLLDKDSTFFTQGRYGRASGGKANRENIQVTPRSNNKFLLGTRFGKRSSSIQPNVSLFYPISMCSGDEDLSCDYTGYSNLFRCTQRRDSSSEEDVRTK